MLKNDNLTDEEVIPFYKGSEFHTVKNREVDKDRCCRGCLNLEFVWELQTILDS